MQHPACVLCGSWHEDPGRATGRNHRRVSKLLRERAGKRAAMLLMRTVTNAPNWYQGVSACSFVRLPGAVPRSRVFGMGGECLSPSLSHIADTPPQAHTPAWASNYSARVVPRLGTHASPPGEPKGVRSPGAPSLTPRDDHTRPPRNWSAEAQ